MISAWRELDVRWKWAFILLVFGMLIVTNIGVVQFYISAQEQDAKAINTAGRQRLLVQTMMTEAERINDGELDRGDKLAQAASEFNASLTELRTGSNGHPSPSPRVKQQIQSITDQWSTFHAKISILQTADPESQRFSEAYQYIRNNKPALLEESDRLVFTYQRASEQKLQSLQNWIFGLVAVDLLVILGIWITISRSIIRPLKDLKEDTEKVAKGDLDRQINGTDQDDDFGMATRSVKELADQLEDAVKEARGFKQAVEQAGHSIYITDTDGTITYVNPAFEDITGYSAEEAIGDTPTILSSEERPDSFYDDLWQQILDGNVWEGEMVNRTKKGERYVTHQTIGPIRNEEGEISRFVAVNTEVTDQKRREQVIEVLNRVLRHNIRNGCNVILGRAGLIREDRLESCTELISSSRSPAGENGGSDTRPEQSADPDEEMIEDSPEKLLDLAEQIESDAEAIHTSGEEIYSMAEKAREIQELIGDPADTPDYLDVEASLKHEMDSLKERYPDAQLTIDYGLTESILVKSDLLAGILEIFRNAVRHSDPPQKVNLTVNSRHREMVEFVVADNGPGIPRMEKEVIQRGEEKPLEHGSGIGLWLVRWNVELASGQLEIEDNDPIGSIITIQIPLSSDTIRLVADESLRESPV